MNEDTIKGQWKQLKGEVKSRWGDLTDDQITEIDGNRLKLVGKVQEAYGIAQDEAEKQVAEWEKIAERKIDIIKEFEIDLINKYGY